MQRSSASAARTAFAERHREGGEQALARAVHDGSAISQNSLLEDWELEVPDAYWGTPHLRSDKYTRAVIQELRDEPGGYVFRVGPRTQWSAPPAAARTVWITRRSS